MFYTATYWTTQSEFSWNSKIIEKIGDTTFLFNFHPETVLFCDETSSGGLRCYEDNQIGFYSNFSSPSCEYDNLSLADLQPGERLILYPNPTSYSFQIKGLQNDLIRGVRVIDILGKELLHFNATNLNYFEVSSLESGIYEIHINAVNKTIKGVIMVE